MGWVGGVGVIGVVVVGCWGGWGLRSFVRAHHRCCSHNYLLQARRIIQRKPNVAGDLTP